MISLFILYILVYNDKKKCPEIFERILAGEKDPVGAGLRRLVASGDPARGSYH